MQIEIEVQDIIRRDMSPEMKAEQICKFANFKKDKIIKALNQKYKTTGQAYSNIVRLHPENLRK